MAVTENTKNNTTTDGTTQTLATITTAGNYQFRISLKNMVDGDRIEITIDVSDLIQTMIDDDASDDHNRK